MLVRGCRGSVIFAVHFSPQGNTVWKGGCTCFHASKVKFEFISYIFFLRLSYPIPFLSLAGDGHDSNLAELKITSNDEELCAKLHASIASRLVPLISHDAASKQKRSLFRPEYATTTGQKLTALHVKIAGLQSVFENQQGQAHSLALAEATQHRQALLEGRSVGREAVDKLERQLRDLIADMRKITATIPFMPHVEG